MRGRRTLRILIVEDEAVLALDLAALVGALGYLVVGSATSAAEAIRLSDEHQPDLALVDVNLSGSGDGTDAATVMRDRDGVRSLFITSQTDPRTRDRAQASWPLGLLSKPVSPTALATALAGAASVILPVI